MSAGIRLVDPYMARHWSSYLRRVRSRRWWLIKRVPSILYVDLFPFLSMLQSLSFKLADLLVRQVTQDSKECKIKICKKSHFYIPLQIDTRIQNMSFYY